MQDRDTHFLDALYLGVRNRAGFDQALGVLNNQFGTISATMLDFDAARPEVDAKATVGLLTGDALARYQRDFAALDPAPPAFIRQRPGTAIPTYRLLPEEKRKPGIFFGEFFKPLGLEECLGGTLASSKGRFAMIGLQRAADRAAFDDSDIARLEALMPHLGRALQLRRSFMELEGETGALAEICDRLAAGVVALDENGRSRFVNAAARLIAAAGDGLSVDRRGRISASTRAANVRLGEMEAEVRAGGAGGVVRVARSSGLPPYGVMVAPLVLDDELEPGKSRQRGVMFVIHDPLLRSRGGARMIADLFGLPQGTANLVAALADNEELKDYAERCGISMNTVRYHLKIAYARTGSSGQTELVRLVTTALRELTDHRRG